MRTKLKYPKGYWTQVIGGYYSTTLKLKQLDNQRRGKQEQQVERPSVKA